MSKDDGGDIVETSLLFQGLLTVREYFSRENPDETAFARHRALWRDVEWSWYTRDGGKALFWHWSPDYGWAMNQEIRGWNECLITYVLATASPTHPIGPDALSRGLGDRWPTFRNGQRHYGIELPLGPAFGGPLLFAQYSFLGLDPRGLKDRYADYWQQNVAHVPLNYEYCVHNPGGCAGYAPTAGG